MFLRAAFLALCFFWYLWMIWPQLTVTFSQIQLYGHDTQCIKDIHSRSESGLLQDDLDQLSNWSSIREMDFNTTKCVSISFGILVQHSTYTLNKSALKSVIEHKDVGVLLTSKCPSLSTWKIYWPRPIGHWVCWEEWSPQAVVQHSNTLFIYPLLEVISFTVVRFEDLSRSRIPNS